MPKLFEADVLPPAGELHPRQGRLVVNRQRNRGYAEKYRQMRAAGIKIPLFWGHQMKRGGPFHVDDKATERARWQAGDLETLRVDPETGQLRVVGEVPPGCDIDPDTKTLIDPVNHTRHSRVSVGIGDWQDGTGKWWEDVPVHVAITPLPVWVWQDGFREVGGDHLLACSADSRVRVRYVLGGTMPVAAIKKPKGEEDDLPPGDAMPPEETEEPAPEAEAPAPEGDEQPIPEEPGAGMPEDAAPMPEECAPGDKPELGDMPAEEPEAPKASPLVDLANQLGIPMPEETASGDIEQVLIGVFTGLIAAGAKITVGGEHDLQPAGEKPVAEAPPMFVLSAGEPTPSGMTDREWTLARKLAGERQTQFRGRCEVLVRAGMPEDLVTEVREKATRFHLSADGDVTLPDAEGELSLLERVAERVAPLLMATLSTADATPPKNPATAGKPDPADPEYLAWLDAQAEHSHGPGSKAGRVK
jgi:hypothetical protein